MLHPGYSVVVGDQGGGPHPYIPQAGFAAGVAVPVKQGEEQGQLPAEFGLAIEENALRRNKNVVKYGEAFHVADVGNGGQEVFIPHEGAGFPADEIDPGAVSRNGKGDGIVFFIFTQHPGGHHDQFVGIGGHGVVLLAAPHYHPVFPSFHNVQILIGVGLLAGPQAAIPLGVGLSAGADQVVFLKVLQIL